MFEGFTRTEIETSRARIHLRHGGDGPPLLLLHGNPLTHVSWHKIAPRLAERFHVIAADLRGYGDSIGLFNAPDDPPHRDDRVALVIGVDLDCHIGPERAPLG